jgi:CheY-like chemotaxis protein
MERPGTVSVLLAEPEATARVSLAKGLEAAGYKVVQAADGEEALDRFRAERTDCVVVAAALSRIRGLEVVRRVKAIARDAFIPAVVLVVENGVDARVEALRGGADAVLGRPCDEDELRAQLEALVRIRRQAGRLADRTVPLTENDAAVQMVQDPPTQPIAMAMPPSLGRARDSARGTIPPNAPPSLGGPSSGSAPADEPMGGAPAFGGRVAEELKRAQAQSEPLALLLIGAVGDAAGEKPVLPSLSAAVRRAARAFDVVAPAGARSVGLLSTGLQLTAAVELAEKVLAELRQSAAGSGAIGVALFPGRDISSGEDLYRLALQALDRALSEGAGAVCLSLNRQGYIVRR